MLIYANHFTLIGADSSTAAFRSVAGWLHWKTKRSFTLSELLSSGEFQESIYRVRVYAADKREPKLYSVLLTHRDEKLYGRFWSTEISIRVGGEKTFISILLETEEISACVKGEVRATRPILVDYLAKNGKFSAGTIGLSHRNLSNSEEDYKALLNDIEKKDRTYPIILVSRAKDGFSVDPEQLQRQVFGLARVVYLDENNNSWEMERICGKFYCAWGGAVNIIFPPQLHKASCYGKLLLREELEDLRRGGGNELYEILAFVTSSTNWTKRRLHFSPVDVRAKRQKDYLLYLREQLAQGQDNTETLEQLLADADRELKGHKQYKETSEELFKLLEKEKEAAVTEANKLRYGTAPKADSSQELDKSDVTAILNFYGRQKGCTPEQCLEFAEQVMGDKIVVLDSAKKSAREAADYRSSHILLNALWKLGNEFLPAFLEGGDNKAKDIFGTGIYAAKESDQTMKKSEYRKARTFQYKGKDVVMWRHLKWGNKGNTRECLRLHFEIDKESEKVVIGHCGAHLDTINTGRV